MKHRRWTVAVIAAASIAIGMTACTKSNAPEAPAAADNVAVLVVDDFTSTSKDTAKPVLTTAPSGNCTVGTNEVGTHGAGEGDLNGHTHGAAVYSVLRERLDEIIGRPNRTPSPAPASDPIPGPTSYTDWTVQGAKGPATLRLMAVNTTGWTTDSAITATKNAITGLHEKFSKIVMNLSFVTIPCDPTALFAGTSEQDLLAWYNATIDANKNDVNFKAALTEHKVDGHFDVGSLRQSYPYVVSDRRLIPLRDCLVNKVYDQISLELPNGTKEGKMVGTLSTNDSGWNSIATQTLVNVPGAVVVPVGAAGNGVDCPAAKDPSGKSVLHKSFPFPFAPALWDFVVSATASENNGQKKEYANGGELGLNDGPPAIAPNSYGTSYSAPRLSAVEAMYLANPGTVNCASRTPTLGYIDPATDNLPPSPSPAPWKNEPWDHWRNYCGDFNPHMP